MWEPDGRRFFINGRSVTLRRGQLSHSVRYMAEAWGWHRARAERILAQLKTETMIETATETGQLIIPICNYDAYQVDKPPAKTRRKTASETGPRQQRDKDNEGEERKNISDAEASSCASGAEAHRDDVPFPSEMTPEGVQLVILGCEKVEPPANPPKVPDAALPVVVEPKAPPAEKLPGGFSDFWSAYPHRGGTKRGRAAAVKAWLKATKAGVPPDVIITGVRLAHDNPNVRGGFARDPTDLAESGGVARRDRPATAIPDASRPPCPT